MQILEEEEEELDLVTERGLAVVRPDFETQIEKSNLSLMTRF